MISARLLRTPQTTTSNIATAGSTGSDAADAAPIAYLSIRAIPNSRQTCIVGSHGDSIKVRIVSAPERGKANDEIQKLLATLLKVPRDAVVITSGAAGRTKRVRIVGYTEYDARKLLLAAAV